MKGEPEIFGSFDWPSFLKQTPVLIAIAGPNGAGKSTFYETFLADSGLAFVNADNLAREFGYDAYRAAEMAESIRNRWKQERRSFIFETVLSDPVGEKVAQLRAAAESGYSVAMIFIGIDSAHTSELRVDVRVSQGGHDVPRDKLEARYPRTIANLKEAIRQVPYVLVFDNSDLEVPYREVALFENGIAKALRDPLPSWFVL